MHNREKYPAIWAAFEKAKADLVPLMEERKVHTDAIKKVQEDIDKLDIKRQGINNEAMKDIDRIRELNDVIARYAKAMGAKTASGA